jgi:hypothetical protein
MTENERLTLRIKAETLYEFMSNLHSDICRLTDRKDNLAEVSCEVCYKLIELRKKLGGFDNDGE